LLTNFKLSNLFSNFSEDKGIEIRSHEKTATITPIVKIKRLKYLLFKN
tara:strand:- start:419 stop:562 length:144 start_codon:yes stop_codon:yes gene_type:complete